MESLQFPVTWPATIQDQTEHKLNDTSVLNFKYLINFKKIAKPVPPGIRPHLTLIDTLGLYLAV